MKKVLILGAGGAAANNFVDAVRQSSDEYEFVGVDTNPYMLALSSCEQNYRGLSADDQEYCLNLNHLISEEDIDFVHIQPDYEVLIGSHIKDRLATKTFLPDESVVQLCQDKLETYRCLDRHGVSVPQSWKITDLIDPELFCHGKCWLRATTGAGSKAALPVSNLGQAKGWIDYWKQREVYSFMLSEFLPGREFAWQSLWYEGELIVSQGRERIEYLNGNLMPSGQSSSPSVARTVNYAAVNMTGFDAVRAVSRQPHGVFCVDMKENKSGVPCVTEINAGRFFTTSNFFARAGLNMPLMYLQLGISGEN